MGYVEPTVSRTLETLVNALAAAFEQDGHDSLCLLSLLPGEAVPFDYCDRCTDGMAWVRLVTLQPAEANIGQDFASRCYTPMSMTIEMGHVFGAPVMDADGNLPAPEEHRNAALLQYRIADLMLGVLICTDLDDVVSGATYTPVGPEGGCVGGAWVATMQVS